ncbi:MAG: hypothetical protein P9L88_05190 [Candidatus Tantalella remota]|nr:hypothetical protein [Candidatus Tantalella remota]
MYNWMNEHNVLRKVIAVISLTAFTFCFVLSDAWALVEETEVSFDLSLGADLSKFANLDVDTFTIPAHLGEVKEVYRGKSKQFVIHLQDAHANFYAQGKISDIIDYLNKEYGVRIVNLEGGVGDYDLSVFTAISGKAIRREVADYFVKKGEINGAEQYAINNPDRVLLWGVEDKDLYLANLKVYRDSLQYMPEVDGYLEELTSLLNDLKRHIYGPRLLKIDMVYNAYKAGNMVFREYLEFLIGEAEENGVNIDEFPNLYLLSEAMEQEEKVDFNKANTERSILIDDLKEGLSQNEVRRLVSKSLKFKTKKISRKAFYGYLLEKAQELGLDVKKYPALSAYIGYITTYEEVDRSKVMNELDELEIAVKEPLYKNDTQRKLNVLSRNLALMKNIFAISLTKTDYKYFLKNKASFNADKYVRFIEKEAPRFRINAKLDPDIFNLDEYLKEISKFYEFSFKRDTVFLKNLRYEESAGGLESAIMMTGGFHTENLLDLFEKAGISYVTILPKFKNGKDYKSPYFEILAGQTTNLQRMLGTVIAKASMLQIASMLSPILADSVYPAAERYAFKASVRVRELIASGRKVELVDEEGNIVFTEGEGESDRISLTELLSDIGYRLPGAVEPEVIVEETLTNAAGERVGKPSIGKGVLHGPIRAPLVKLVGENTYDNFLGPLLEEVTFYLIIPLLLKEMMPLWEAMVISRGIFIILHPFLNKAKGNRIVTPLGISLLAGGVEVLLSRGYVHHLMEAVSLSPLVVGFFVLAAFHILANAKLVPTVNRWLERSGSEYRIEKATLVKVDTEETAPEAPEGISTETLLDRYDITDMPGWEGDPTAPIPQLVGFIGEGTAAVVFRARLEGVEQDIAVKVRKTFSRDMADNDEEYDRIQSNILNSFQREIEVQKDLSDIGSPEKEIMPGYYSVNMGGVPAFGMEIIEGVNTVLGRPQGIAGAVNERTRSSAERVLRTFLQKGYDPRDLQFMILTKDQVLNGRSYQAGEVVLMDVGGFVTKEYGEDQIDKEVSGGLSELDRQIRVARTESRIIEAYNSLHDGGKIETILQDPGSGHYKVIFTGTERSPQIIKQVIYLYLLVHFRSSGEVPDLEAAIEGSGRRAFLERALQGLEDLSARFFPYLERTFMLAKVDAVSFGDKRVARKAIAKAVPLPQPITGNIANGMTPERIEKIREEIEAPENSDAVRKRNTSLVELASSRALEKRLEGEAEEVPVEQAVEEPVPAIIQFEALKQILQSKQAAREMAEWQNGSYYRGIGEEAPQFILPEEEGTDAEKERIAINLAGVYALESGLGVICERDNVTPLEVLTAINDRTISEEDMLLMARFANATWKAGQVFRSLDRIERDTFRPAVTLVPEELEKDFDQIYAAAEQLYNRLNYAVSEGMDAEQKRYQEEKISELLILVKNKGTLTAEEEKRLRETALTVMYAHKDQRRKDGQPYFVHQVEVASNLVEMFGVTDPVILQIALLHDTREDEVKFYDDFRTFAHETIRRVGTSEGRMAEQERVDETLLGVRMLSKLEGEKYEKEFPDADERQAEYMRRLVYPKTAYDDGRPGSENWYTDDFIHDIQRVKLSDRISNMRSLVLLFSDGAKMDDVSLKEMITFSKRQLEKTQEIFISKFVDNPDNQLLPEEVEMFYTQFASAIRGLIALQDGVLGERVRALAILAKAVLDRLERKGVAEQTEAAKAVIADMWQNKTDIIVMPGSKLEAASQAPVNRSAARKLRRDYGQDTIPFDYGYGPDWKDSLLSEMPRIEAVFNESMKAEKDPRILFFLPITQAERDRVFEAGGLFEKYVHLKDHIVIVQEGNIPDDGVVDNVMHIVLGKALLNYNRIGEANFDEEAANRLVSFMGTLVEPGSIDFDAYKDAPKEMLNDIVNGVLTLKIKKIDFAEIQDWKRAQDEVLRAL